MYKVRILTVMVLFITCMACSLSGAFLPGRENREKIILPTTQDKTQVQVCPTIQCPTPEPVSPPAFEFFEDGDIDYELEYDVSVWQFVETTRHPAWPRIVHRDIKECELFEQGATEPPNIPPREMEIGEYIWTVYGSDDTSEGDMWFSTLDSRVKIRLWLPTWRDDVHEQCRLAGIAVLETVHLSE